MRTPFARGGYPGGGGADLRVRSVGRPSANPRPNGQSNPPGSKPMRIRPPNITRRAQADIRESHSLKGKSSIDQGRAAHEPWAIQECPFRTWPGWMPFARREPIVTGWLLADPMSLAAHWTGCLRMNAQRSGHRGPRGCGTGLSACSSKKRGSTARRTVAWTEFCNQKADRFAASHEAD